MMEILDIPDGCNSARFVAAVLEMREAVLQMSELIEAHEITIVTLERRIEELERR